MKAREEVWVDAPPEEVFRFVADPGNFPEWMAGIEEARLGIGSTPGPGATLVATLGFRGSRHRIVFEVTAFDPASRLAFRTVEGPYPVASTFTFEPDDSGTTVTYEQEVIADTLSARITFILFAPFTRRMVRKRLAWELDGLADVIEEEQEREGEDGGS